MIKAVKNIKMSEAKHCFQNGNVFKFESDFRFFFTLVHKLDLASVIWPMVSYCEIE